MIICQALAGCNDGFFTTIDTRDGVAKVKSDAVRDIVQASRGVSRQTERVKDITEEVERFKEDYLKKVRKQVQTIPLKVVRPSRNGWRRATKKMSGMVEKTAKNMAREVQDFTADKETEIAVTRTAVGKEIDSVQKLFKPTKEHG